MADAVNSLDFMNAFKNKHAEPCYCLIQLEPLGVYVVLTPQISFFVGIGLQAHVLTGHAFSSLISTNSY